MTITVILFLCAFLNQRYGTRGLLLGAGFRDLPIPTPLQFRSPRSFLRGRLAPESAVLPILFGFATNTLTKAVVAFAVGGYRFALTILPGLIAVVLAAFFGMWLGKP